jgi:siroheme synthase-like protein
MSYFPIFLQMTDRRCLVIGGGAVAERKIAGLLEAGAVVTVISPDINEGITRWSKKNSINFIARGYRQGDLAGYELVFVATDDTAVNTAAFKEGRERNVWVNAADDPAHCDFILPSVLQRGDLTVAVSSGAHSPALARTVREELEYYFTGEYELLTQLAAEIRDELKRRAIDVPFETWRRALSGEVRQVLMRGDLAQARTVLLKDLAVIPE